MKNFLPKNVELTEEVIVQLKEKFELSDNNIEEIKYWNDENSPYSGVVVDTDEGAHFLCYPYDRPSEGFQKEFPEGKLWNE